MEKFKININPLGESYLLIDWPQRIEEAISKELLEFERRIKETFSEIIYDSNPSYASLCLHFNKEKIAFTTLREKLKELYQDFEIDGKEEINYWRIPVCYAGDFAPDMASLCATKSISSEEIIERHTAPYYRIFFIGFLPGFLYLGGLDPLLAHPRKATPRRNVAQGAVGIAGNQTGIYPQASPGGWQLIGQTPLQLFEPQESPPMKIAAGDYLQFHAVDEIEFTRIKDSIVAGNYTWEQKTNNA